MCSARTRVSCVCVVVVAGAHRYGDEQHLDEALDKIFRFGKAGSIPRKNCPRLTGAQVDDRETQSHEHSLRACVCSPQALLAGVHGGI